MGWINNAFSDAKNTVILKMQSAVPSITFVTSSIHTKWILYQRKLISLHFPGAVHIVLNGKNNWPYSWFDKLKVVKDARTEYVIFVDEDFFFFETDPLFELLRFMGKNTYSLSGVSDGYHHYRQQNPVAFNSFFLVLRQKDFQSILRKPGFWDHLFYPKTIQKYFSVPVQNDFNSKWMQSVYPHTIQAGYRISPVNFEPYYPFFWTLLENEFKFHYLYPHFNQEFKSTNPRLSINNPDIGYHMWFTRKWDDTTMDVHGMTNFERYTLMEQKIQAHLQSYF